MNCPKAIPTLGHRLVVDPDPDAVGGELRCVDCDRRGHDVHDFRAPACADTRVLVTDGGTDVDGYLRFDHPNVGYVIDGIEDATVRYNLERDIAEGDRIELRTPNDVVFATATVEDAYRTEVRHAWVDMVHVDERSHPATGLLDLLHRLDDHYDQEIRLKDSVTVIYFDVEQLGADAADEPVPITDGGTRETHLTSEGLWIPPDLREFTAQIVFRTPRATIQLFQSGCGELDAYYGMIDENDFGDPDDMRDARNEHLAPNRVSIKRRGEEPIELVVNLEDEIVADGGYPTTEQELEELKERVSELEKVVERELGCLVRPRPLEPQTIECVCEEQFEANLKNGLTCPHCGANCRDNGRIVTDGGTDVETRRQNAKQKLDRITDPHDLGAVNRRLNEVLLSYE